MSIDELFKIAGIEISGLSTTTGRERNPATEYVFLVKGEDVDQVGRSIRGALDGNPLRLVATVFVSDGVFECTVAAYGLPGCFPSLLAASLFN